jgi:hypothetical protein
LLISCDFYLETDGLTATDGDDINIITAKQDHVAGENNFTLKAQYVAAGSSLRFVLALGNSFEKGAVLPFALAAATFYKLEVAYNFAGQYVEVWIDDVLYHVSAILSTWHQSTEWVIAGQSGSAGGVNTTWWQDNFHVAAGGDATATGDQTLAAITQAGTGSAETVGTAAQTLSALSQAGSGTLTVPGAGAQVLAAITQAGEGAHTTTAEGAGDQTIAALTQAGDGTHTLAATGTSDQTLEALTQAGAAEQILSGTAAQILAAVTQAGVGLEIAVGVASQVLAAIAQAASAEQAMEAAGAQVLAAVEQAGAADVSPAGAGTQTLPAAEQAGTGAQSAVPASQGHSGVNRLALSEQHATTARAPSLADVGRRREELRARSDDVQLRAPVQPGDFVDPESGAIVRAPSKGKVEARAPAVTTPGLGIDAPLPDDDIAELRDLLGKAEARRRKMMTAALLLYYAEAA